MEQAEIVKSIMDKETEIVILENSSQSDDESISSDHSMIYTLISTAALDDDEVEPEDSCDSLNLKTAQTENYVDENEKQESEESAKKEQTKQVLKEVGLFAAKAALISGGVLGGIALAVPALGFGAGGVAASSLAAIYQSTFLGGTIASGSAFAVLQSVGAAGLAASTQAALVGGSVAATGIQTVISKVIKSKKEEKTSNGDASSITDSSDANNIVECGSEDQKKAGSFKCTTVKLFKEVEQKVGKEIEIKAQLKKNSRGDSDLLDYEIIG